MMTPEERARHEQAMYKPDRDAFLYEIVRLCRKYSIELRVHRNEILVRNYPIDHRTITESYIKISPEGVMT